MIVFDLSDSVVGHRNLVSGFKFQIGYVSREFHLSFRLLLFGARCKMAKAN